MLALLIGVGLGALPEDQLQCEQAISHLRDCCSPTQADVCGDGCNPITLSLEESACIQAAECEALVAADVCGRVERLAASNAVLNPDAGPPPEPVCP